MKQKVSPELIQQRMWRMIKRNRAFRQDMAATHRSGIFYFAEMLIETKLLIDHLEGKRSRPKSLVMEVAPDWVSETTAHRIIRRMGKDAYVTAEVDPQDHRSLIIKPTPKLIDRSERRWMRVVDDECAPDVTRSTSAPTPAVPPGRTMTVDDSAISPRNGLTPEEVAARSGGAYGAKTLANWRGAGLGPDFVTVGGMILYPVDRLTEWENRRPFAARH